MRRMSRRSAPLKDTRLRCTHCGAVTWSKAFVSFMRDHDRPQGGRCLKAAAMYPTTKEWTPSWRPGTKRSVS